MVALTVGAVVESELLELGGGRSTRNESSSSMDKVALAVVVDEKWH